MRAAAVVIVATTAAALLSSCDAASPQDETEPPPMLRAQLAGYDLTSEVQAILEAVDGQPPAPSLLSVTAACPGQLQLQSERRDEAGVIVALNLSGDVGSLNWRVTPMTGGVALSEGVLPAAALEPADQNGTRWEAPALLAPIRINPSTPFVVEVSAAPGQAPVGVNMTLRADVLYASSAAVDEVQRRLGQARWYSRWHQTGVTAREDTLTVQRGGRPTYVRAESLAGVAMTVAISLDGTQLIVPAISITSAAPELGRSLLAHSVEAGQVYRFTTTLGAAGGRGYWLWHGPSWADVAR